MNVFFKLREHGSSVRTEIIGGVTTFITMAYIMVVNPAILSFAGIPAGPGTVATILTAMVGCALMGLIANRPIAVAPYMVKTPSSPSASRLSASAGSSASARCSSAALCS